MRKSVHAALGLGAALTLAVSGCGALNPTSGAAEGPGAPRGVVTMIVPFSAGGGSDLSGRAMASGLEASTGGTVTVQNVVGGSGAIGYAQLLGDAGKAGTLLASETALMTLPVVQDVPFDYTSFTPVMKAGDDYNLVIVGRDSPWQTCTDVIDAARTASLAAAVSGSTGPDNIAWTLIENEEDIELQRVTFESSAEVTTALLGGNVDVAAASPGEVLGQLQSGDVRALCALAPERYQYPELADVPTGGEQGIDVTFAQWRGFIGPPEMPEESRQYWMEAAREWSRTADYTDYIESNFMQPSALYGDEFTDYLSDYDADVREALS